jgi:predicted DNA-binding transcriptional regulator YafY
MSSRADILRGSINRVFGIKPDPMSEIKSAISDAALGEQMVRMTYIAKKSSGAKTYVVEPYSYRTKHGKKYLYAWHPKHNQIHSFLQNRIIDAEPMERGFDPRFPVEI